ncbi:hypothetical protein TSMEX_007496 [Taenia solium]|eukprot:TsM_001062300 transcript=TsM_001062300 gene=TsM_001062300
MTRLGGLPLAPRLASPNGVSKNLTIRYSKEFRQHRPGKPPFDRALNDELPTQQEMQTIPQGCKIGGQ